MNFMRPDRPMPPTVPTTKPVASPAPMPVMPVIGGPAPMPGPAPIRMPRPGMPGRPEMPMLPISPEGTLKTLMLERDRLQARLDQLNSRIQELMQGQGSGFPERKPQEGIESLLEVIMRPDFGD